MELLAVADTLCREYRSTLKFVGWVGGHPLLKTIVLDLNMMQIFLVEAAAVNVLITKYCVVVAKDGPFFGARLPI